MEARLLRSLVLVAALTSLAASYRTTNFVVTAPSPRLAEKIGRAAEQYRRDLAIEWLGQEIPRWSSPCPISAQVAGHLGAGGATSFVFHNGQVGSWRMSIQGSELRILDSVLPHEVTHTIFATHFRQPLPRWADEGACTTVEHSSERARHQKMLVQFLQTNRGISFSRMFAMREYPPDVLPLYAQGFSLARYFIEQGGRRHFVQFVETGLRGGDWVAAVHQYYGYDNLAVLQNQWLAWVRNGSPPRQQVAPEIASREEPQVLMAAAAGKRQRPAPNLIYHGEQEGSPSASPDQASQVARPTAADPTASGGWYPRGSRPVAGSAEPVVVTQPAAPNRHQAVRQQPLQQPLQRVLR
ncbi:MAG: hypothetical protein GTO53_11825 [Planctomycetales bacterium]|nr:hypothetical protein [Planctomycetales bacterium]NIM09799.1 hypothetical protein [Planctomycetales bacterium]NIN09268.1 hypothetical protein [Planctomycetales bacterium]NIN78371.1 hypothetical protein [Planctomycetales bacterium]NIO35547.1 hypothetical protein [Planctomycetales bacterium]